MARSLLLDNGATRLAIVTVDSCYVPRRLLDDAKRRAAKLTGIAPEHMLIAATHTHSAPPSKDTFLDQADPRYQEHLTSGIAASISRVADNLAAAEIGWSSVDIPEEVFNRRWYMKPGGIAPNPFGGTGDRARMNPPRASEYLDRPAGPTDPELAFLSVRSLDGRPFALLANYSLHYVDGVRPGGVSADYFGEFARQIEQRLARNRPGESPFVGILSNGTSGDVNNINFRLSQPKREPFEQIRIVAGRLADAVAAEYRKVKYHRETPLAMAQRGLNLKLRRPTEAQLQRAKRFLAEPDESKLTRRAKPYAKMVLSLAERPPAENPILQTVRIGELGIAAIPCGVFVEIGLDIKERSPLPETFTIELANGHYNYLPTPRQHRLWPAESLAAIIGSAHGGEH